MAWIADMYIAAIERTQVRTEIIHHTLQLPIC